MNRAGPMRAARKATASAVLFLFALLVATLPRTAGAVVVHAHEGHGLHAHFVSGLEEARSRLDRERFHARHHAHAHCDGDHTDHDPEEGELFLGLPSEPFRLVSTVVGSEPPPLERCAPFLAAAIEPTTRRARAARTRPKPPRPRGRAWRSGSRLLVRTSAALRL